MEKIKTELVECTMLAVKEPYAYDFQGKKGTSYSATLLLGDKVIVAKCDESVYNDIKELKNQGGKASFGLSFYDGKLASKLDLLSFDWE